MKDSNYTTKWPTHSEIVQEMGESLLRELPKSAICKIGGMKSDEGKPEYDRLSWESIGYFNSVHKYGDEKYEKGNWRKGLHVTRLANAAIRHISSILSGRINDEESGLLHSAHAGVCLEMITHMLLHPEQYKEFIDIEEIEND